MAIAIESLTIGEVSQNGKGAKTAPIYGTSASSYIPGELTVVWQPRSFNGEETSRVSISFNTTPQLEADVTALEQWCMETVAQSPKCFFGQDLSPSQIKDRFNSLLKTSEKGYRSLRVKMNTSGKNVVRCWSQMARAEIPEDWTSCGVKPRVAFRGLWFSSKEWGILAEMTDAGVFKKVHECPFDTDCPM